MKRFLTLTLGVALLAAAPLSAQSDSKGSAAEILAQAQAAAARGDMQQAAELAQAAATLIAALEAAHHGPAAGEVRGEGFRIRNNWAEPVIEEAHMRELNDADVARVHGRDARDARAAAEREHAAVIVEAERSDQEPRRRALRFGGPGAPSAPDGAWTTTPPGPNGMMRMRAQAPNAPQDELGMTLKLIHAEVQALRAEVQAMRAEMALMRAHGGAAHAPSSMEIHELHGEGGEWHGSAPGSRHKVIFIGPDGRMIEHEGEGMDFEWVEDFGHDGEFEIELEDVTEDLNELGYIHEEGDVLTPDNARMHWNFNFDRGPQAVPPVPATPATPATPSVHSGPSRPRR